jgi:hypothetical protein
VLVKETTELAAGDNLGRLQVLGLWGLLFVSMLASRTAAREIVRRITPPERCIILGGPAVAGRIHRKLQGARSLNVTVVGMVALESGDRDPKDLPVLGELDSLGSILRAQKIDRVIIAPSRSDPDQLLGAIRLVKSLGAKVSVHPRMFEVVGSSVHFDDVEGLMLLGVPDTGLTKSSRFVKRGVDLVGSAVGIVVLAPLLAAVALVVRLTTPGPAVFRQTRIGREGREFEMGRDLVRVAPNLRGAEKRPAKLPVPEDRGRSQRGEHAVERPQVIRSSVASSAGRPTAQTRMGQTRVAPSPKASAATRKDPITAAPPR